MGDKNTGDPWAQAGGLSPQAPGVCACR